MPDSPGILFLGHKQTAKIAPDKMPQNVASHLGLYCLFTGISSKNEKLLLMPLKNENVII